MGAASAVAAWGWAGSGAGSKQSLSYTHDRSCPGRYAAARAIYLIALWGRFHTPDTAHLADNGKNGDAKN